MVSVAWDGSTDEDDGVHEAKCSAGCERSQAKIYHPGPQGVADECHGAFSLDLVDESVCEDLAGLFGPVLDEVERVVNA